MGIRSIVTELALLSSQCRPTLVPLILVAGFLPNAAILGGRGQFGGRGRGGRGGGRFGRDAFYDSRYTASNYGGYGPGGESRPARGAHMLSVAGKRSSEPPRELASLVSQTAHKVKHIGMHAGSMCRTGP